MHTDLMKGNRAGCHHLQRQVADLPYNVRPDSMQTNLSPA